MPRIPGVPLHKKRALPVQISDLAQLALCALPLGERFQEPGRKSLYIELSAGDGTVVVGLIAKDWHFLCHSPVNPGRMEYPKESPFVVP